MRRSWLAFLAASLLCASAQAKATRYVLDPKASRLVIHVGKAGLFGFAGHEHEILAGGFEGTVLADTEQIAGSSLEVTFAAPELRVTGNGEPSKDVPKVQETMVGPQCLDVGRHPAIRFVSRTVAGTRASPSRYDLEIRGDLTLHGVTRALSIPVRVDFDGDRMTASGRTVLRQTDFGIKPITVAGVVKVKDELALEWTLVGRR
jgi:polyisoprenoid-binding protein YceI